MTPAARNDENLAFMPSSNDSLYSNVKLDNTSAKSPPNSLPPRSTSSPYFTSPNVRSSVNSSKAQSPMSLPPPLPRSKSSGDRAASSQSQTQPTTITSSDDDPDPADQVFWYNLHMETLANFERERSTWRKLTDRLTKEVECLRHELHQTRTRAARIDPRADSAFASNVPTAVTSAPTDTTTEEEDDKVFLDRAIIAQAHAKLRELSVTSPDKEVGNPFDKPSPTTVDGVTLKRAPITRQSSNEAKSRAASETRKVTISDHVTPIEEMASTSDLTLSIDDPPSPPQTAVPRSQQQSPPPHNFIMHAGNTPISIRARLARESLFGRLAEANKAALNPGSTHSTTGLDPASELSVTLKDHRSQTSPPKNTNPAAGSTTLPTSSASTSSLRRQLPPSSLTSFPTNPITSSTTITNLNGTVLPIDAPIEDGDRELRSPKMLPTNPSTPSVQSSLRDDPFSILAQKLEMVAADPENPRNQPEVLRSCRSLAHEDELGVRVEGGEKGRERGLGEMQREKVDGEKRGEGEKVGKDDGKVGEGDDEDGEGEEGGKEEIQIKLKKSTNFGCQLGSLR